MKFCNKKKKPRDREANWDPAEKEFLRQCVSNHLSVIESKGNDTVMVLQKKHAWKAIEREMITAGYDRDISKLKSQWVRMKVNARKAVENVKASVGNGNSEIVQELSPEDSLILGMIAHEFEDDKTLTSAEYAEFLKIEGSDRSSSIEKNLERPDDDNEICIKEQIPIDVPVESPQYKKLPSISSKKRTLLSRQRHVTRQTLYLEQINTLQVRKLNNEIEHLERMHQMEEEHKQELHALKLHQLQKQMEYEEEIHRLKVEQLRKAT